MLPSGSGTCSGSEGGRTLRFQRGHYRIRGFTAAAVGAALSLMAVTAATAAAQSNGNGDPRTFFVDAPNPEIECPNADFPSIQAAVAAAPPESKIIVCPGLYTESVTVPKALELKGQRKPQDAPPGPSPDNGPDTPDNRGESKCFRPFSVFGPDRPEPSDPTREAIVTGGAYAFNLQANGILIDGFVLQRNFFGIRAGSFFGPRFSGFRIRHNVIQDNRNSGISIGGSRETRIDHNCLRSTSTAYQPFGVSAAPLANARIDHNYTYRNRGCCAIGIGSGQAVEVSHNRSLEDQSFLSAIGSDIEVVYNDVSEPLSAAIGVVGLQQRGVVEHNRLRGGFADGIVVSGVDARVRYNDVRDLRRHGVWGPPPLDDSLIAYNRLNDNGQDGLNLGTGDTGNRVEHNEADSQRGGRGPRERSDGECLPEQPDVRQRAVRRPRRRPGGQPVDPKPLREGLPAGDDLRAAGGLDTVTEAGEAAGLWPRRAARSRHGLTGMSGR